MKKTKNKWNRSCYMQYLCFLFIYLFILILCYLSLCLKGFTAATVVEKREDFWMFFGCFDCKRLKIGQSAVKVSVLKEKLKCFFYA